MLDYTRLSSLAAKGYCCSQIVLQMGLEDGRKEENPGLIQAAAGLCGGLHAGLDCGILSGAACLIALCLPEEAPSLIGELVEWFNAENGGVSCKDILAGDDSGRLTKCPKILAACYEKVWELLEERGYDPGADR